MPATIPMSATPSAIRPTISSESRSSRSTLTCGCAARNERSASREETRSAHWCWRARAPGRRARPHRRRDPRATVRPGQNGARVLQQRAAGLRRRDACRGCAPAAPAPSASSMWRMRVLAAASARCARSAPCVMLPASTTWRNRLRSSDRNAWYTILRLWRRLTPPNAHCLSHQNLIFFAIGEVRRQALRNSPSVDIWRPSTLRPPKASDTTVKADEFAGE